MSEQSEIVFSIGFGSAVAVLVALGGATFAPQLGLSPVAVAAISGSLGLLAALVRIVIRRDSSRH